MAAVAAEIIAMNGLEWDNLDAQERLLAEFAVTQDRTHRKACDAAPDGRVLGIAESLAVDQAARPCVWL